MNTFKHRFRTLRTARDERLAFWTVALLAAWGGVCAFAPNFFQISKSYAGMAFLSQREWGAVALSLALLVAFGPGRVQAFALALASLLWLTVGVTLTLGAGTVTTAAVYIPLSFMALGALVDGERS